jgi:hypothetical protein
MPVNHSEFVVTKLVDATSTTFDQPVPPKPSAFDVYADANTAQGGTSIASVTDLIIDPFNPSAAFGDGSVRFVHDPVVVHVGGALPVFVQSADLDGLFKPLFAFTSLDLM